MIQLEDILGSEVELRTDDLFGWRGEGFARVADGWVSIPGALPGEKVHVLVEDEIGRGRRTFAKLIDVIEPSVDRTNPHCDRVDICRGCQLRGARPAAEADFKETRIRELLAKHNPALPTLEIGRTGCPVARQTGYRWRSNLTYRAAGQPQLGLVSGASEHLIPMGDCPSLTPECRAVVTRLERAMGALSPVWPDTDAGAVRSIEVWASEPAWVRVHPASVSTRTDEQLRPLLTHLQRALPEAIVTWETPAHPWFELPYRADELPVVARAGAWVHATAEPAEALYRWLRVWLGTNDGPHLDVGCGVGAISMLAADSGRAATGIDRDRNATASAVHNGATNDLELEIITADWEKGVRDLALADRRFATATLNPMREPIGDRTLAFIERMVDSKILLLGPSPEAASKEVAALRQLDWNVANVWNVDLHPASYQTMMAVELTRPDTE